MVHNDWYLSALPDMLRITVFVTKYAKKRLEYLVIIVSIAKIFHKPCYKTYENIKNKQGFGVSEKGFWRKV